MHKFCDTGVPIQLNCGHLTLKLYSISYYVTVAALISLKIFS